MPAVLMFTSRSPIIIADPCDLVQMLSSVSVSSFRDVLDAANKTIRQQSLIFTAIYIVLVLIDLGCFL